MTWIKKLLILPIEKKKEGEDAAGDDAGGIYDVNDQKPVLRCGSDWSIRKDHQWL